MTVIDKVLKHVGEVVEVVALFVSTETFCHKVYRVPILFQIASVVLSAQVCLLDPRKVDKANDWIVLVDHVHQVVVYVRFGP